MTAAGLAVMLAAAALALRVRSIRKRGVWSEEALYFFFCAAVAALLISPYLAGTSRISFVEESQVTGVERVPTTMDELGFFYAALMSVVEPVFWLLCVIALEAVARVWAAGTFRNMKPPRSSPMSMVSRGMGKPLLVTLGLLVGPAFILWAVLRVALADPALLLPAEERMSDATYLYVAVLARLALLIGFYSLPAQLWLPDWAPKSGGAHPWANPNPNAAFGPSHLAQLGFPGDLFNFLSAALPWIIAAVLLAWLVSSGGKTAEPDEADRKSD
jgi:hypothetical protein